MPEVYYITGLPVPGESIPSRIEFNTWATPDPQDSIQVSLMIRALERFYQQPYTDPTSYFQVASIHGYPETLGWNNIPATQFCTHNKITFPTWHRPYMLLFEQRLSELMKEVIAELTFPDEEEKKEWLQEAERWRLPYWDWGLPGDAGSVPRLFRDEMITIRRPAGVAASSHSEVAHDPPRENPLARYQLKDESKKLMLMGDLPPPYTVPDDKGDLDEILPWSLCSGTSRWAVTTPERHHKEQPWSAGTNQWGKANEAISEHNFYSRWREDRPDLTPPDNLTLNTAGELVYRMLSPDYLQTWQQFATTDYNPGPPNNEQNWKAYLSLEYIHNNLHNFIGGTTLADGAGHMGDVPVAAFDPIFWFHHCNIDRLFAMWQTLNKNLWFEKANYPRATEKLTPFYYNVDGKTDLFDSNDVRDWTRFGYQYDMLQRVQDQSEEEYIEVLKQFISRYATTAPLLLTDPAKVGLERLQAAKNEYPDYIINIIYDRFALGGSPYLISFFLGGDPTIRTYEIKDTEAQGAGILPNFVGSVYTFTRKISTRTTSCENCNKQSEAESLSSAQLPLTGSLYFHLAAASTALNELTEQQVTEYLRKNLVWVATSSTGSIIEKSRLPKTKIFVLAGTAKHVKEIGKPSKYLSYTAMPQVTKHMELGATTQDYSSW